MPTYVYACDSCGKQFEQFQSFKDEPLKVCPACQTEGKVRRVIQPAGVVFKGSGWYITDSRGGSSSSVSSAKSDGGSAKSDGDSAKTTSETAPSASESTTSDSSPAND